MTEVAGEINEPYIRIKLAHHGYLLHRSILASVIHEDQLIGLLHTVHHQLQPIIGIVDNLFFIIHRHNHAILYSSLLHLRSLLLRLEG
ncbi:hypothetical protein D3C78_906450 [compost metagenome]